jgi:catechol 2,3-dioxygenase-like lactoylglutathione lyase family enzyme
MSRIPSFDTIDHYGVTVPDLEQAIAFFTDGLGAEIWYREGPSSDPDGDSLTAELGVHPRAVVSLAMLKLGSSTTIELLEYSVPDGSATTSTPPNSDHSAAHLGLRVTDVEAAAEYLSGIEGVRLLHGPVTVEGGLSDGLRWRYFTTPWGLMMELVQLPDGLTV